MKGNALGVYALSLALAAFATAAYADSIPVGFVSYDVTGTNVAQFDINNQTGPNSTGDATFPVSTSVSLSSLSLDVKFSSGPDAIFGSSYFTLNADGISWMGNQLSTIVDQTQNGLAGAISATLTGSFDTTTFLLFNDNTAMVSPTFSATISDPTGLADGDFAIIDATTSSGPPPTVPEPTPFLLIGTGLLAMLGLRFRGSLASNLRALSRVRIGAGPLCGLLVAAGVVLSGVNSAGAQPIKLNANTNPSIGTAGVTTVTLSGTGFPTGTVSPGSVTIAFSSTCGGTPAATELASAVTTIVGGFKRLTFLVPASLPPGTFYISVTDGTLKSSNCAVLTVTAAPPPTLTCLPTSSMAVITGKNVDAYVPKGSWSSGTTGVSRVPIEGTDTPAAMSTPTEVNSCSSNSVTGETVCVDNGTGVFLIKGATITNTLTSSSNGFASFSGGSCHNCGVAINALTNTAVIAGGFTNGTNSGDGLQTLNLANNTFSTPFYSAHAVSENISIDPSLAYILSPNENNIYDIYKINKDGSLTEYGNAQSPGGEFDSAAEDCTTEIALSTQEFTNNLFLADLKHATFTAPSGGAPAGTWTAPSQSVLLNTYGLSAGTSGISVAPGSTHLGLTSGEFGGDTFVVFELPATAGTGTTPPNLVDYAGAVMPPGPDGNAFTAGFDPHTITAYTSPNNNRAYGLLSDWSRGFPTYVGVIDLEALLKAPRSGLNTVDPTYDLIAHGIVRYVAVP
jgi:hypothetical protein